MSYERLSLQILGPLRLCRDGAELDAGPRQQAFLLALLLAHAGRPISTSELIDLVWDDDVPATAVNILYKYVGALRRLLEPALPVRGAGSYLVRRGAGYLFTAAPGMVDAATFRDLVETARMRLVERRPDVALDDYAQALGLWRGPAGGGLALGSVAMPVFTALNEEFFDACVAAAQLAVSQRRPELVLQRLRLAASMAPLHETVQASLVTVLGAAGRQAEALSVFQVVRALLADELGIDPGPALQAAHRTVLSQPATIAADAGRPTRLTARLPLHPPAPALVGRADEVAVLRRAVGSAFAGDTGLVIVEGEPGVGKTRVLEEIAGDADRRGAVIAWGRCPPGGETPPMWAWVQAARGLLDWLPDAARKHWRASEFGRLWDPRGEALALSAVVDGGLRFRLFEQTVDLVGSVSAERPVVLVVDDLQWADATSLELFGHLAARLPAGTAVIGALRDRAPTPGPALTRMLAAASRLPAHHRIRLGPLGVEDVAELVHGETGHPPDRGVAHAIHIRSGGNPFLARELSRLLPHAGVLSGEMLTASAVPSTVRDVVRDRTAGLDAAAASLLQIAAFIGRDVDLGLLARAAGIDVQTCLDLLESLEALGLVEPTDPFSVRFPHDLVRESVVMTTPRRRAAGLHLRIAEALEHTDEDGPVTARLAHHLWASGPLAHPARTIDAPVGVGRRAATVSAF